MGARKLLVSTAVVAGVGVGGYCAYIHSLTRFLDVIPPKQAEKYFKAINKSVGNDANARRFTFAYRVPTVLPSHCDMVEVFGEKAAAKQAPHLAADEGTKASSTFAKKKGNVALGSLFALQSLEKATPLKQLRSAALFWENFQVSSQWNYFLHNRKATMRAARETVKNAKSASQATALVEEYCSKLLDLTTEKDINATPELRMATVQASCGTTTGASLELADKEGPRPREAGLYVFYSAPIPEGVEEASFNYWMRKACGDWYTRWLAVSATNALTQL